MGLKERFPEWWRRWMVWVRGECIEEGCDRPAAQFSKRCWPHELDESARIGDRIRKQKFERDVQVTEEALRRLAARASRD